MDEVGIRGAWWTFYVMALLAPLAMLTGMMMERSPIFEIPFFGYSRLRTYAVSVLN
jgi:thiosulfate reductase cytochrome b subunit